MKNAKRLMLGLTLTVMGGGLWKMAHAQEPTGTSVSDVVTEVGMFRLRNNTANRITYHVRWGNGPWMATTVDAGKGHNHWLTYDPKGIPAPEISFNPLVNQAGPSKRYQLMFGRSYIGGLTDPNKNHPRLYQFLATKDAKHVDVYKQ